MKVLSGIQPSGQLHIGNYFGMMARMIRWQNESELFCFIVNYHALTSVYDGQKLASGTRDAVLDFLALGLDPEKSIFWVQSDVPEVTELTWILTTLTPMGLLERCHSYKDKIARGLKPHHGIFAYPVLMAADILLYQSELIPVGKDQKQHVEVARDIAIKFNNTYGEVFTIPEVEIPKDIATIPGIDGQKMSKSYGNTIEIFGDEKETRKKIMSIVTDSKGVDEPKDPEACNVYNILKLFLNESEAVQLADQYKNGGIGYGDAKKMLFERLWEYFKPYREKREKLQADQSAIDAILENGAKKARAIAMPTLEKVKKATGLYYR